MYSLPFLLEKIMISTVYGIENCSHCRDAKEKYPDATYIDVRKLSHEEKVELREKIKKQVKSGSVNYPILFDEKGDIVL